MSSSFSHQWYEEHNNRARESFHTKRLTVVKESCHCTRPKSTIFDLKKHHKHIRDRFQNGVQNRKRKRVEFRDHKIIVSVIRFFKYLLGFSLRVVWKMAHRWWTYRAIVGSVQKFQSWRLGGKEDLERAKDFPRHFWDEKLARPKLRCPRAKNLKRKQKDWKRTIRIE
jgi:hypothetical protein